MKRLNLIAVVAVVDVILLVPLIYSASFFADNHDLVRILGPVHGFGFLVLIGLCIMGVGERWWGWWFPAIVAVTLGPVGSLVGDYVIRKRIKETGDGSRI